LKDLWRDPILPYRDIVVHALRQKLEGHVRKDKFNKAFGLEGAVEPINRIYFVAIIKSVSD
jgi:hypothetical protein